MVEQDRSTAIRLERMGMGMLSPEQGLSVMATLMGQTLGRGVGVLTRQQAQVAANPFMWRKLLGQMAVVPSLFAEFDTGSWDCRLFCAEQQMSAPVLIAQESEINEIHSHVMSAVRGVIGFDVNPAEPLLDTGLDSLTVVEFKSAVTNNTGVELPATAAFDYPSVDCIASYIHSQLRGNRHAETKLVDTCTSGGSESRTHSFQGVALLVNIATCTDGNEGRKYPAHVLDVDDEKKICKVLLLDGDNKGVKMVVPIHATSQTARPKKKPSGLGIVIGGRG